MNLVVWYKMIEARLKRIITLIDKARLVEDRLLSSRWDCMLDSIIRIEEKYFHCENCVFKDVFLCTHRGEAKKVLI